MQLSYKRIKKFLKFGFILLRFSIFRWRGFSSECSTKTIISRTPRSYFWRPWSNVQRWQYVCWKISVLSQHDGVGRFPSSTPVDKSKLDHVSLDNDSEYSGLAAIIVGDLTGNTMTKMDIVSRLEPELDAEGNSASMLEIRRTIQFDTYWLLWW